MERKIMILLRTLSQFVLKNTYFVSDEYIFFSDSLLVIWLLTVLWKLIFQIMESWLPDKISNKVSSSFKVQKYGLKRRQIQR